MDYLILILTTVGSIVAMFLIAKLMGRKSISQMTLFDYITGISVGSIAAEMATELEDPFKPLIAMVIYGAVAFLVSIFTIKSLKARKYLSGTPTVIMKNGIIYRENMKKTKMDINDFLMMCRISGYFDISQLQVVFMEHNGSMSYLPYPDRRPANPADLSLSPEPEGPFYDVIMDGKICEDTLKKCGRNKTWLMNELHRQGYRNVEDVFLGICDDNNNLALYKGGDD